MKQSFQDLLSKAQKGDQFSIARLLTHIEMDSSEVSGIVAKSWKTMKDSAFLGAPILGITGAPGAGKSSLLSLLIENLAKENKRVAVLCVDPSSPFSGGAILGDRIRMLKHSGNENVFIRSLGTRGRMGGLTPCLYNAVLLMSSLNFDFVFVETVGVGQTEIDIMNVADVVSVILVPEAGDGIQVMKAGLMEIGDLVVVNKSDRPDSKRLFHEVRSHLDEEGLGKDCLMTNALQGDGVKEFMEKIQKQLYREGKRMTALQRRYSGHVREIIHHNIWKNIDTKFHGDVTDFQMDPVALAGTYFQ